MQRAWQVWIGANASLPMHTAWICKGKTKPRTQLDGGRGSGQKSFRSREANTLEANAYSGCVYIAFSGGFVDRHPLLGTTWVQLCSGNSCLSFWQFFVSIEFLLGRLG